MRGVIKDQEVTILKPASELIGQNWGMGFFKSVASDYTDDVMNETADITIGDAWLPEYTNQTEGNNVIIIRNEIINQIVKCGIDEGRIKVDLVDKETIIRSQASHFRHTHDELAYRLYLKDKNMLWRPKKRVSASNDLHFMRKNIQKLRLVISKRSNEIYKESVNDKDFEKFSIQIAKLTNRYKKTYQIINLQRMGIYGIVKRITNKLRKISSAFINS